MSTACQESGGTLGMLESNLTGRKGLSILDILGKKRRDVAFHLWGGSSAGGREQCDRRIQDRMDRWKKRNPSSSPREASNEALKVVCDVCRNLFQGLSAKVQLAWEEKAKNLHLPQTDEERYRGNLKFTTYLLTRLFHIRQCLVDAVLPYIYRLLSHLSEYTTLHFVLLASGLSLVRYHHVILGGVVAAFCEDTDLPNLETEMWSSLRNIWAKAVRTLARAVVELRADVSVRCRVEAQSKFPYI